MSKLVEKLKRVGERAEPIGFATKPQGRTPSLVLLAVVEAEDSLSLEAAWATGADALLLRGNAAPTSSLLQERPRELPWGLEAAVPNIPQGCDFLVLEPQAPLSLLREAPWGRLLRLALPFEEGFLQGLASLPIDALLVDLTRQAEPITLHQLALCQQALGLCGKRLILGVPAHLSPTDLVALRDAGVHGVALALQKGDATQLRVFGEAIAALPPPKRRGERPLALLPWEAVHPGARVEEEDDQ